MVRVLKAARVFDKATGRFIKEFEKVGVWSPKRDTEDRMTAVGKTKIGLGVEQPEIELETQGDADILLPYFGTGVGVRIVGSFQNGSRVETREIELDGEIFDFARGDMEMNKKESNGKPKITCTFYRETLGTQILFEYDSENEVLIVDGNDLMAIHRANVA